MAGNRVCCCVNRGNKRKDRSSLAPARGAVDTSWQEDTDA